MSGREKEIKDVATKLDDLLDELAESVAALNAILTRPAAGPPPETDERLVAP